MSKLLLKPYPHFALVVLLLTATALPVRAQTSVTFGGASHTGLMHPAPENNVLPLAVAFSVGVICCFRRRKKH